MSTIPGLLRTVLSSIADVFLVTISGFILARLGVLDVRTQRKLTRVNVALFTPALIFTKVAFTLSPDKFRELWIVPVFFVALTLFSAATAAVLGALFRLRRFHRNYAIAAAMFMNTNSLPVALLQSLVANTPTLGWGDDDSPGAMLGRGLTYLTLCSSLSMLLRWSIGVQLLTIPASYEDSEVRSRPPRRAYLDAAADERSALLASEDALGSYEQGTEPSDSRPNSYHVVVTDESDESADDSEHESPPLGSSSNQALDSRRPLRTSSGLPGFVVSKWRVFFRLLRSLASPPLCASVASIVIALWPQLQHALSSQPVRPVRNALAKLGGCSIPLTLVVLGAFFVPDPDANQQQISNGVQRDNSARLFWRRTQSFLSLRSFDGFANWKLSRGEGHTDDDVAERGEGLTVFVAIVSRMLVIPALGLPVIIWGSRTSSGLPVFDDPVFILSLILVLGSPPAITLAQMVQVNNASAFERLTSRTLFWSYCVLAPISTVILAVSAILIARAD